MKTWSVKDVCAVCGITPRTLHHYDELGLVVPSRNDAGHRRYADEDVSKLQRVLVYRSLGFTLAEIDEILEDPSIDVGTTLADQAERLQGRIAHLQQMLAAVQAAARAEDNGMALTPAERLEVFGGFDPVDFEEEVKQRWGDTDAYEQSSKRTSSYSKEDWVEIKAEADAAMRALGSVMRSGQNANSDDAIAAAEEHRRHVNQRFYDCQPQMHAQLGEMYVADARFTKTWDDIEPGLAEWVRDAFAANAARQGR